MVQGCSFILFSLSAKQTRFAALKWTDLNANQKHPGRSSPRSVGPNIGQFMSQLS